MKTKLGSLLFFLFVCSAQAHSGYSSESGFNAGFGHPLGGSDHFLAMVAIGLWAAQLGGRAVWLLPASFVGMMAVGGSLGWTGILLPFVEPAIMASIIVVGLIVALALRWPLPACAAVAGVFALFHGHAHGMEIPEATSKLTYAAGFMVATMLLHGVGLGIGWMSRSLKPPILVRVAGGAIAATGVWLIVR